MLFELFRGALMVVVMLLIIVVSALSCGIVFRLMLVMRLPLRVFDLIVCVALVSFLVVGVVIQLGERINFLFLLFGFSCTAEITFAL